MVRFYVILLGLVLAVAGCQPADEAPVEPKVRPAKLVTVTSASTTRLISFPAVVEADNSSEMTFQVGGQITELTVLEGDEVQKGQVIARVEERDYQNSLVQAQAQYDNAESEYQRAKRLADQDAISRSVLETRRTNRDVAKAALDTAKKTTGDTILRAPFSGFISKVYVKKFQNIQAKEAIANIQSDAVVAVVNAPADIVARTPQLEPRNTLVVLDSAPNMALPATFKEASGQADPTTQTYEVSFSFKEPDNIFVLPGMTATVNIDFEFNDLSDIVPSGIAVPVSAVMAEGPDLFVWRVNPANMKVAKISITTGMGMSEDNVIVTRGLRDGDKIVAAGGSFLHEGMTVRAWQPE